MSVTATNAAISAGMAAQASAEASRAHDERCKAEILVFDPKAATVAQMQSYAGCVRTLHPTEQHDEAMKFVVGALMAAAILGAIVGWVRQDYDWFDGAFMGAILGLMIGMGGLVFVGAWLFLLS